MFYALCAALSSCLPRTWAPFSWTMKWKPHGTKQQDTKDPGLITQSLFLLDGNKHPSDWNNCCFGLLNTWNSMVTLTSRPNHLSAQILRREYTSHYYLMSYDFP